MTRTAGSNTVCFAVFGTLGYVREHAEFEGLLPRLMPQRNLKFCMFSITYPSVLKITSHDLWLYSACLIQNLV